VPGSAASPVPRPPAALLPVCVPAAPPDAPSSPPSFSAAPSGDALPQLPPSAALGSGGWGYMGCSKLTETLIKKNIF